MSFQSLLKSFSYDEATELASDIVTPWLRGMGFKVELRELYESFMWDGFSFNGNLSDRHLIHDLAHWILASEDRRSLPEFGLGAGPESDAKAAEEHAVISTHAARDEESKAALLGILIQHALGIPCGCMLDEVGMTPDTAGDMFSKVEVDYQWLIENGHINCDGVPIFMLQKSPGSYLRSSNKLRVA